MFRLSDRDEAALVIQKEVRAHLARKKYAIKTLKFAATTLYPVLAVGNDPILSEKAFVKYHLPHLPIALLGTSALRSLQIVCELGTMSNIPKLIIIDNSSKVYIFWELFRQYIKSRAHAVFLNDFDNFIKLTKPLYHPRTFEFADGTSELGKGDIRYYNPHIGNFINTIINKHGYEFVKKVVGNTTFIRQTWGDEATIRNIVNILTYGDIQQIAVYVSNIGHLFEEQDALSENKTPSSLTHFLEIIEAVDPVFSIHSNYCPTHKTPEKIHVFSSGDNVNRLFYKTKSKCLLGDENEKLTFVNSNKV